MLGSGDHSLQTLKIDLISYFTDEETEQGVI